MKHMYGRILITLALAPMFSACGGGGGGNSNQPVGNRSPIAQNFVVDTNEDETVSGQLVATDADGVPIAGASAVIILLLDQAGNELSRTFLDSPASGA